MKSHLRLQGQFYKNIVKVVTTVKVKVSQSKSRIVELTTIL